MSDKANVNMIVYQVSAEEKKKLEKFEDDIMKTLLKNNILDRPFWISKTSDHVRLCLPTSFQPRVILELPSKELDILSCDDLISRLNKNIGK